MAIPKRLASPTAAPSARRAPVSPLKDWRGHRGQGGMQEATPPGTQVEDEYGGSFAVGVNGNPGRTTAPSGRGNFLAAATPSSRSPTSPVEPVGFGFAVFRQGHGDDVRPGRLHRHLARAPDRGRRAASTFTEHLRHRRTSTKGTLTGGFVTVFRGPKDIHVQGTSSAR